MNPHRGFIALITVIIISAILLGLISSRNYTHLATRFNLLDSELKAMSRSLAEACLIVARLKLIGNENYSGGEIIKVSDRQCAIKSVTPSGTTWPKTITAQAVINEIYTNLKIEVDQNLDINLWQEVPVL